jgi:hypothetical protein
MTVRRLLWVIALCLGIHGAAAARPADPSPEAVLRQYFALVERHHYAAALRLRLNDIPLATFAAAFRRYRSYHGHVGRAGEGDSGAGSSYVEVPVRVEGFLRSGRPFSEQGSATLRMVHPIPGTTAAERRWHIYRTDVAPRFD